MRFRVDNLVAGYGRIEVVHGVSIEVPEGDRVGLFGPNGHGKTTLLRAISGLIDRRGGAIRFGDRDLTGASSSRHGRGGRHPRAAGQRPVPAHDGSRGAHARSLCRPRLGPAAQQPRQGADDLSPLSRAPLAAL